MLVFYHANDIRIGVPLPHLLPQMLDHSSLNRIYTANCFFIILITNYNVKHNIIQKHTDFSTKLIAQLGKS